MNTNEHEYSQNQDQVVRAVIGASYTVSNALGCGFLEKVYQRALALELARVGIQAQSQVTFTVLYRGQSVGEYIADLIVEDRIVVELKCVVTFTSEHLAQCLNYLKASGLKLALLINFQKPKVEWKRIIL